MKKKRSDETRHIEGWQSKNERIESLLNVLYDFRFNTVKSRTEYRAAGSSDLYQPVTKFALNTFRRRLDATADIATSTDNIRMILESDFARKVHPIQEYFNALPLLNPADMPVFGRIEKRQGVEVFPYGMYLSCEIAFQYGTDVLGRGDNTGGRIQPAPERVQN